MFKFVFVNQYSTESIILKESELGIVETKYWKNLKLLAGI